MNYPTCKTCKHWDEKPVAPHWTVHRCGLLGDLGPDDEAHDDVIVPDEGCAMSLATGPDFGCVHHDEKSRD